MRFWLHPRRSQQILDRVFGFAQDAHTQQTKKETKLIRSE